MSSPWLLVGIAILVIAVGAGVQAIGVALRQGRGRRGGSRPSSVRRARRAGRRSGPPPE